MKKRGAIFILLLLTPAVLYAQRKVQFTGDFETGKVQKNGSTHDGLYIGTLPVSQTGDDYIATGNGGFGPTAPYDTRVVGREVVGGETITPRAGDFFMRSAVYFEKNYMGLNGDSTDPWLNKPRSFIYATHPTMRFDYDVEIYIGFSIYIPLNFEHENGVRDSRGSASLFVLNADTTRTLVTLAPFVQSPSTEAHWWLTLQTGATSTEESQSVQTRLDLGPIKPDIGKWTDYVFRVRSNPFAVDTNPAAKGIPNSKNQMYQGNKGILQVWKAEGSVNASGNRSMMLKVNKVNTPVGMVPHATELLRNTWRIYKYGWHRNPTTVKGPVWFGFDELRFGLVGRDGTGYADVNPSGLPCVIGCPGGGVRLTAPNGVGVK